MENCVLKWRTTGTLTGVWSQGISVGDAWRSEAEFVGEASEWTGLRETLAEHGAGDGHRREAWVREQIF